MKSKYISFLLAAIILAFASLSWGQSASPTMVQDLTFAISAIENLEYEKAVTLLQKVISEARSYQGPEIEKAHKFLGIAYMALGKREDAYKEFIKSLTINRNTYLDPNNASPEIMEVFESARESIRSLDLAPPKIEPVPVTNAFQGKELEIEAKVTDDIQVSNVLLFYRSSGSSDFKTVKMMEFMSGRYIAKIPSSKTNDSTVQYYIEAYDTSGGPPSTFGSENSPKIVLLKEPYFERGPGMKIAKWTTFGVGLVGIGVGIYYTASAVETQQAADQKRKDDKDHTADKLEGWVNSYNEYSYIAYGAGAAMLITSGVLFILDAKAENKTPNSAYKKRNWNIYPTISPDATGVTAVFRF